MDIGIAICENPRIMRFHIGNVIEKIRSDRGLNQAELAALAHIRANTLGDLENRRKNTRLETLEKVAESLAMSVGELYCELDHQLRKKYLQPSSLQPSICPENNQEHISYHEKLEECLHHPNADIGNAVIFGLLGAYGAMPPEGERLAPLGSGFLDAARPGKRLGRGKPNN